MKNKLIVISAPSGAGKTTLCTRLLQDFPELVLSISSTTRPPRGKEQHGREYFFLSKSEFESIIRKKGFAEWAEVHGNCYGTSRQMLEDAFARNKSVLLDIDVQGAASLKKAYPERTFAIFIAPPSMEVLEARLRSRGTDSNETIQRRLKNARNEMEKARDFDRIIINDDLDTAYNELKAIVATQLRGKPDDQA